MKNTPPYFFLAALLMGLLSQCAQKAPGNSEEETLYPFLTVLTNNQSEKTLYVWMEDSYEQPDSVEYTSSKTQDTLRIPIRQARFVNTSHIGAVNARLLVFPGDTLMLDAYSDRIDRHHRIGSQKMKKLSQWTDLIIGKNIQDSLGKALQEMKQSLLPIDSSVSVTIIGKKEKYVDYGMKRADLSNPDTVLLGQYLSTLREKRMYDSTVIRENVAPVDSGLAALLAHDIVYRHHKDLQAIKSFYPDLVHDRAPLPALANGDVLHSPYSRKLLMDSVAHLAKPANSTARRYPHKYGNAFNQVPDAWPDSVGKYARFLCIEMMVDLQDPYPEVQAVFARFKEQYPEDRFTRLLEKRYLFDLEKYSLIRKGLQLINPDRKLHTLDALLDHYAGQLVYIDFWASWCAPCRAAMPASHRLASDYVRKGVQFVYISTDAKYEDWVNALREEKLNPEKNNYLIINSKNSDFLQQIQLNTIPRYLLYGKDGKLIHQDAPGPDNPALRELIDQHL